MPLQDQQALVWFIEYLKNAACDLVHALCSKIKASVFIYFQMPGCSGRQLSTVLFEVSEIAQDRKDALAFSQTYCNTTLADLGLIPGSYRWS